jgi:hypothetical protein
MVSSCSSNLRKLRPALQVAGAIPFLAVFHPSRGLLLVLDPVDTRHLLVPVVIKTHSVLIPRRTFPRVTSFKLAVVIVVLEILSFQLIRNQRQGDAPFAANDPSQGNHEHLAFLGFESPQLLVVQVRYSIWQVFHELFSTLSP